jgi:hypothetical protein
LAENFVFFVFRNRYKIFYFDGLIMSALCERSPNVNIKRPHDEDDMLITEDDFQPFEMKRYRFGEYGFQQQAYTTTFACQFSTATVAASGEENSDPEAHASSCSSSLPRRLFLDDGALGNVRGGFEGKAGANLKEDNLVDSEVQEHEASVAFIEEELHESLEVIPSSSSALSWRGREKRCRSAQWGVAPSTEAAAAAAAGELLPPVNPAHMQYMYEKQLENLRWDLISTYHVHEIYYMYFALRTEIACKDREIEQRVSQTAALSEENKVLKRGINILEGRLRETSSQIVENEHVFAQAAQYISELERTVYTLRSQLFASSSSGIDLISPQPPPDVC